MKEIDLLILGATGFIGSEIYQYFRITYPHLQIAIVLRNAAKNKDYNHPNTTIINQDLRWIDWTKLHMKFKTVIHCARINASRAGRLGRWWASWQGAWANKKLLHFLSKNESRLLFISGSLMYGNGRFNDQEKKLNPLSFAREYFTAEKPIVQAAKYDSSALKVQIIRVPWVLGNGSWYQAFYHQYTLKHKAIPLYGDGQNLMSFVGTKSIAKGLDLIYQNKENKQPVFHLAYSQTWTQQEFVRHLATQFQLPIKKIDLATFQSAIQEAFSSSIELIPSPFFAKAYSSKLSEQVSTDLSF